MAPRRAVRTTYAIAVLTVAAWLLAFLAGPHLFYLAGFVPARATQVFPFVAVPFVLTPLTATLIHAGLLHIGFNLLLLVYCGRQVETVLGGGRLIILYVVGAYGAALAHYLAFPTSTGPMVGASGAVSAVLAAYAMMFGQGTVKRIGPIPGNIVRAAWLATAWIVLQWGIGFVTGGGQSVIATAAHVGGFVTGLVLVYPLLEWRYRYG